MLTVTLHLINGDVLRLTMTPGAKHRLSRTLGQATFPAQPFTAQVDGETVEIPWRSICYLGSREGMREDHQSGK